MCIRAHIYCVIVYICCVMRNVQRAHAQCICSVHADAQSICSAVYMHARYIQRWLYSATVAISHTLRAITLITVFIKTVSYLLRCRLTNHFNNISNITIRDVVGGYFSPQLTIVPVPRESTTAPHSEVMGGFIEVDHVSQN